MLGTELCEYHSGYRAYRIDALQPVPLERNSDDFDFDTHVLIQLQHAGKRVVEIPIPTFYGDEISRVNGLRYARPVSAEAARYRLAQLGLGSGPHCLGPEAFTTAPHELKEDEESSHGQLLGWIESRPPGRVLDLGCSSGLLAEHVRKLGHHVVGVDVEEFDEVKARVDEFVRADLDQGISDAVGHDFDVVPAADIIEPPAPPAPPTGPRPGGPRRGAVAFGAEFRSLVPALAYRLGTIRRRPARHPRSRASAVLHQADHSALGARLRLRHPSPGGHRSPDGRPQHEGEQHPMACCRARRPGCPGTPAPAVRLSASVRTGTHASRAPGCRHGFDRRRLGLCSVAGPVALQFVTDGRRHRYRTDPASEGRSGGYRRRRRAQSDGHRWCHQAP